MHLIREAEEEEGVADDGGPEPEAKDEIAEHVEEQPLDEDGVEIADMPTDTIIDHIEIDDVVIDDAFDGPRPRIPDAVYENQRKVAAARVEMDVRNELPLLNSSVPHCESGGCRRCRDLLCGVDQR